MTGAFRFLRWPKRLSSLERDLLEQSRLQGMLDGSDDEELRRQEIRDEFGRLGREVRARGSSNTSGAVASGLPWWLVVGPPATGKTTLIQSVEWPVRPGETGTPTRLFCGRISDQAVLLDTEGAWATDDLRRDEWRSFLKELSRHRGRRGIDALIFVVSASELVAATPSERKGCAQCLRGRFDDVVRRLGISPPVHLWVTGVDRLAGFHHLSETLDCAVGPEPWGVCLSEVGATRLRHEEFEGAFAQVATGLAARVGRRLGDELSGGARQELLRLPLEFSALGQRLRAFLDVLSCSIPGADAPRVRAVHLVRADCGPDRGFAPHWEVIERERWGVIPSRRTHRRRETCAWVIAIVLVLLASALVAVPAAAWVERRAYLRHLVGLGERAVAGSSRGDWEAVDRLRIGIDRQMSLAPAGSTLVSTGPGRLGDSARELYGRTVWSELVEPLVEVDVEGLGRFLDRYSASSASIPTVLTYEENAARLRCVLLLSQSDGAQAYGAHDRPIAEPRHRSWLVRRLVKEWQRRHPVRGRDAQEAVRGALEAYVGALAQGESRGLELDAGFVERVRDVLRRVGGERVAVHRWVSRYERLGFGLELDRIVSGSAALVGGTDAYVRGAFTRRAWEHGIRDALYGEKEDVDAISWVVGGSSEEPRRQVQLREHYLQAYASEWRSFIDRVSSAVPEDGDDSVRLARSLAAGAPTPLEALVRSVDYHTTLRPPPDSASSELRDLHRRFRGLVRFVGGEGATAPPPIEVYLEQVRYVRDALQTQRRADGPDGANDRLAEARDAVRDLIESQEVGWRADFERLLWPVIEGASESSESVRVTWVGRRWCAEVHRPWSRDVGPYYPFRPNGPGVSMEALERFLHPERGALWRVYGEALSDAFPRHGGEIRAAEGGRLPVADTFHPRLVRYLRRAAAVSETFFSQDGENADVGLDLRVRPSPRHVSVTLSVDGQRVVYENGPDRWVRVRWPDAEAETRGASIAVVDTEGMRVDLAYEGDWGFLRLLDVGEVRSAGEGRWTMRWPIPGSDDDVRIDVRPTRRVPMLFPEGLEGVPPTSFTERFRQATPPAEIVVGKTTCQRN